MSACYLCCMKQIFGTSHRQDGLMQVSRRRWEIFYGYGEDANGNGYDWRETFDHKPHLDEIKSVIIAQINANTDNKILHGLTWKGHPVYLSTENQFNFKAAHDLAVQTEGKSLPVKFKLGEDADGTPAYYTFETVDDIDSFYSLSMMHIQQCLYEGWKEKDELDMTPYTTD